MGASRQSMIDIRLRLSLLSTTLRDEIGILRSNELSLAQSIKALTDQIAANAALQIENDISELPTNQQIAFEVSRVIRELLLNIAKYSGANNVQLSAAVSTDLIEISILDDGLEFDPGLERSGHSDRFGVTGLQERLAEIGGSLSYVRADLKNTITLLIPR